MQLGKPCIVCGQLQDTAEYAKSHGLLMINISGEDNGRPIGRERVTGNNTIITKKCMDNTRRKYQNQINTILTSGKRRSIFITPTEKLI